MNPKFVLVFALAISCLCCFHTASANEEDHQIIVAEPIVDPQIDMKIDDIHVTGTYYDKSLKASEYPKSRKEFDAELLDTLTDFGMNFANDVVVKNSYIITLGPRYLTKLTSLVAHYLPEFNKQQKDGGPKFKDGFIGDAITIWPTITKSWLVEPELRAKVAAEVPKDSSEFMKKFRLFLDICQIVGKQNPLGLYIDWSHIEADGKTIAEMGAPFVIYLQEHGYKKAIGLLDSMMGLLAKIKPGSPVE